MNIVEEITLKSENEFLKNYNEELKLKNRALSDLIYYLASREMWHGDIEELINAVQMPVVLLCLENVETSKFAEKINEILKLKQLMLNAEIGSYFVSDFAKRVGTFKITKAGMLRGAKCE